MLYYKKKCEIKIYHINILLMWFEKNTYINQIEKKNTHADMEVSDWCIRCLLDCCSAPSFFFYFEFWPFLFILTRTHNAAIMLEMKLFQTAHIFVKKLTSQSSKQIMSFNSLPQLSYDTPSAIRHKFPSPQTIKQLR